MLFALLNQVFFFERTAPYLFLSEKCERRKIMKLFTRKQVFITTLIAGPMPAAMQMAKNYENQHKMRQQQRTVTIGYLLGIITYLLTILLIENTLIATGIFNENRPLAFSLSIAMLIGVQAISAFTLLLVCKKKKSCNVFSRDTSNRYQAIHAIPYYLLGLVSTAFLFQSGGFWFMVYCAYLIPNLYLFIRLKQAFEGQKSRIFFSLLFIFFAALFPLNEIFEHHLDYNTLKYSFIVGFYAVPLLLSAFSLYLIIDLLILINRLPKLISVDVLRSFKFRRIVFIVVALISVSLLVFGIYNYNHSRISAYEIDVPAKDGNPGEFKIAMAADLHLGEQTTYDFVHQFVEKIEAEKPDILVLAGDIIESDVQTPKIKKITEQFKQIKTKYGVYAVEGNHDRYRSYNLNKQKFFSDAEIKVLHDTIVNIAGKISLAGRRDRSSRNRLSVDELLAMQTKNLPLVLADHQPYNLDKAYNANVDIQLSGHTHYGQMLPLNFVIAAMYELSWGYEKIKNTHFFVTCGAQGWGPPVKTAGYSEIMIINLKL